MIIRQGSQPAVLRRAPTDWLINSLHARPSEVDFERPHRVLHRFLAGGAGGATGRLGRRRRLSLALGLLGAIFRLEVLLEPLGRRLTAAQTAPEQLLNAGGEPGEGAGRQTHGLPTQQAGAGKSEARLSTMQEPHNRHTNG